MRKMLLVVGELMICHGLAKLVNVSCRLEMSSPETAELVHDNDEKARQRRGLLLLLLRL